MAVFSLSGSATNTASATAPMMGLSAASSNPHRLGVRYFATGSDATPAESAFTYKIQRGTTVGTAGSTPTPQSLNPADSTASSAQCGLAVYGGNPTLTASAFLLIATLHQRNTFQWYAMDADSELVIPATANNGVFVMSEVVGGVGAVSCTFELHFRE
jgi:hypothetical protein